MELSGWEPAGEPWVPGNGSVGRPPRETGVGRGAGPPWPSAVSAPAGPGKAPLPPLAVPLVDPAPPALRPSWGRVLSGGLGRGIPSVPKEVCLAALEKHVNGETWISRPRWPYCHHTSAPKPPMSPSSTCTLKDLEGVPLSSAFPLSTLFLDQP